MKIHSDNDKGLQSLNGAGRGVSKGCCLAIGVALFNLAKLGWQWFTGTRVNADYAR